MQVQGDAETRDISQLVDFSNEMNHEQVSFCDSSASLQYRFAMTMLL